MGLAEASFEWPPIRSRNLPAIDNSPSKNQIASMVARLSLIGYDGDSFRVFFFANGVAIPSLRKEESQ